MITARIIDDELITEGQPAIDDVYPGVCCEGFDWVVDLILLSVYGHCQNPDCPTMDDTYGALSSVDTENLALYIAGDGRISDRARLPGSILRLSTGLTWAKPQ